MTKTILVVDDSVSVRLVAANALKGAGYEVIQACDGRDALGILERSEVNLILSKLDMPKMDGISFVAELKKKSAYDFIPVIMLVAGTQRETGLSGKADRANEYLEKPLCPERVLDAVSRLMPV